MKFEGASFRSSMCAQEFANQFSKFVHGIDTYAHDVKLDNGEFVVHLRKPTFSEKMKMTLMPPKMKQERVVILHSIIRDVARRVGIDGDQLLRDIRFGNGPKMADKLNIVSTEIALKSSVRQQMIAD